MIRPKSLTNTSSPQFVIRSKLRFTCPLALRRPPVLIISCRAVLMFAAAILTLAGCASVEVQRGKNLASSGVQYTKATATLIDVATDAMIDADSEAFVRTKLPTEALSRPENSPEKLQGRLEKSNEGLVQNTKLFLALRTSLSTVGDYFAALQTLTDNPQSEATASAVSSLADRVNTLNKALKEGDNPVKPILSDEQKTALSGLTKLVADQIHGVLVGAALRRDAPIIGESLLLQEKILDLSELIISGALIEQNNRFFVDKVQKRFKKQDIDSSWVMDRNKYIKAKAIGETSKEIKAARDASKQMRKTWEKILSGVYDTSEMRQQIEELNALVAAMVALKQAEKPKAPTQ